MGVSKKDWQEAMLLLLDSREQATSEEIDSAIQTVDAYQKQLDQDCKDCRYWWDHSTSEAGEHHGNCPQHPEQFGSAASRVRCFHCGVNTSLSSFTGAGATVWVSRGDYGSCVDRVSDEPGSLRIEICDACLLGRKNLVLDSASGQWAAWKAPEPPDLEDRIRFFKRKDSKIVVEDNRTGWRVTTVYDSVLEALEGTFKAYKENP